MKYKIKFLDYWHTSSGLSTGADVDLTVLKDEHGLPILPGKTLKGLFREAAENLKELNSKLISKDFIHSVFGEQLPKGAKTEDEHEVKEADSFFSDARFSDNIYKLVINKEIQPSYLYKSIASTQIDENGQAKDFSLRQMEVTVPVELYAEIYDFDKKYEPQMELCFKYVKRLGLNRNRGLGRCEISKINEA
jgi:CRISPR/Cas system CSM-associated protein Csm3 (group 7 of RAMP superfamily)